MTHWSAIRKRAREEHRRLLQSVEGDASVNGFVRFAAQATGLRCVGLPRTHALLDGAEARLDLDHRAIWYRNDVEPWQQLFYQAHELAHFWLHRESFICTDEDIDPEATEEEVPAERAAAYSPRERMEREANVFAREFLLPTNRLKQQFLEEGKTAFDVASETGLPEGMVLHQMSRALLAVEVEEAAEPEPPCQLDPSQEAAAFILEGPVLVEAGPGTGKTSTLTARLEWLLTRGPVEEDAAPEPVAPQHIVALTFSNKAAEEIRARVAQVCPKQATEVWMGTFHAFGLELLLKYGPWPIADVVDPVRSLAILEELLPDLDLNRFQNLAKPSAPLTDVLDAISRAKDELCDPVRFRTLAQEMHTKTQPALKAAENDKQRKEVEKQLIKAEKSLEAASVYEQYQAYLVANELYDFGDLIFKAVQLLQENDTAREEVQRKYQHVLVDEIQDVNRASAVFLKLLAGDGKGLWMVGDERQAIYRFRGASTTGIRGFAGDPNVTTHPLEVNYRSQQPIIDVFTALVPHMKAGCAAEFKGWKADSPLTDGMVQMEIAGSPEAEGAGLAADILRQWELYQESGGQQGARFRDQAVLCRTNKQLAAIAVMLEQVGVPTLYLGNFFERPEVADLLSLLELTCERGGRGLYRVACFPEYAIPLKEVQALQALARERDVSFPAALALAEEAKDLSLEGKQKIALLRQHLGGVHPGSSPWGFLSRYLFNRSNYLRTLLGDESVSGQQARVALLQLLEFAYTFSRNGAGGRVDPKWRFLQHIRRMIVRNDDRVLWQVPEWAVGVDAVRLLTIHASKGLEFKAVYLPMLGKGLFPASWRGDNRPIPDGLLSSDPKEDHYEEEECLLFVACSRARDLLCLSRAAAGYQYRRGKPTRSNPSDLLLKIADALLHPPDGNVTWPGEPTALELPAEVPVPEHIPEFSARELDDYLFCPKKYFYEHVAAASHRMEASPYLRLHGCVRSVLYWLLDQQQNGKPVEEKAAMARLQELWEEQGPKGASYEAHYRKEAERVVANAVRRASEPSVRGERPEWTVELPYGRIRIVPDHVEIRKDEQGPVATIQRWKTGRISSKEKKRPYYALLQAGARTSYASGRFRIEICSLRDDETEEVIPSAAQIEEYEHAVQGILRGDFPPNPDSYECPHCPYFFICPVGVEG